MAKIPKNLSDKDMFKDYQEEPTLEETFVRRAKDADEREKRRKAEEEPAADIRVAYLTPDIIEKLGKLLLELKMVLFNEGVRDYRMTVRREGRKIILEPEETAK